MKKYIAALLALTLVFALTACQGSQAAGEEEARETEEAAAEKTAEEETAAEETEGTEAAPEEEAVLEGTQEGEEEAEDITGGWELTPPETSVPLPQDVQEAFDKISGEMTLLPAAYIASQVVAGTNYMLLCWDTAEMNWKMAVIYKDLQGGAELRGLEAFNAVSYTEAEPEEENAEESTEEGTEQSTEQLSGGWTIPDEYNSLLLPEDAQQAFDKAVSEMTGNSLNPLVLLGTQLVSGTNYAILCRNTYVTAEPVSGIQVVTIYADLEGTCQISNIRTVDPAAFNN